MTEPSTEATPVPALPPLPDAVYNPQPFNYTADHMQAYARAALASVEAPTEPAPGAQNPLLTMDEWKAHARKYRWRFDIPTLPDGIAGEAPTEPSLLFDGMTAAQLVGNELFEFQEATGCDTAAQYKAKVEAPQPSKGDNPATNKWWFEQGKIVAAAAPVAQIDWPLERAAFTDWFDRRDGIRNAWTAWQARAAWSAQAIRNGEAKAPTEPSTLSPTDEQIRQLAYSMWGAQVKRLPLQAALQFARAALALKPEPAQQAQQAPDKYTQVFLDRGMTPPQETK